MTYCVVGAHFMANGLPIASRRALSKAFDLVQGLLLVEHPRTLHCFFDVILMLLRKGLGEIVSLLRHYISEMAAATIATNSPWRHICRLIGIIDAESLNEMILQSWKCMIDAFEEGLGPFNLFTLGVRMNFVQHVYRDTDALAEESFFRGLLARCKEAPGTPAQAAVRTRIITLFLGYLLIRQGRYREAELLVHEVIYRVEEDEADFNRKPYQIEALVLLAWSQNYQHKMNLAEKTMRDVIGMLIDLVGAKHHWTIQNMIKLEEWLREWGREMEADELQRVRDELIGKDEIDELSVEG